MKKITAIITALALLIPMFAYSHGGGCRKSSPAGQCCHKDHSTGNVHCH